MAEKGKWDGRAKGGALGNLIFRKIIQTFGPFAAYALLGFVAWYYAIFDHAGIRALRKFRKNAGFEHTNIFHLYRHFYSFGMALIDKVTFSIKKNPPFTFTFINENNISEALSQGKGVILLSAHIGNWEIIGNLLSDRISANTYAVLLDNEKPEIKEVFKEVTKSRRFITINISNNILDVIIQIKEALKNNGIVCFLADRFISSSKTKLQFFGEEAVFPTGPFEIAAITGAPILPVFTVKDSMTHFTAKAYPSITFEGITRNNRNEHIKEAMKSFISNMESEAKKHPYQWFNFFDVWEDGK